MTPRLFAPEACRNAGANNRGVIGQIVGSCNFERACYAAAYKGNITLGIVDSCNSTKSCYFAAAYKGEINTINNACNSDYACWYAATGSCCCGRCEKVGDIPSGIIGCCNTGTATNASEGICYKANETTLFTKDPTCSVAPVSVPATADSGSDLINKEDEVEFLTDLEHEIYKLVKELAKNKKD